MKKSLLLFVCVMVIGMQSVMAQTGITAPTMPEELTLQNEMECYLYNVGFERFFSFTDSNYGDKFLVKLQDDGNYSLYLPAEERYVYSTSDGMGKTGSLYTECKFIFAKTDGGYTIQRLYNYNETQFVGMQKGDVVYGVYSNMTEGNLVWKLLPATEATELFMAKAHLYHSLITSESYTGCNFDKYKDVYTNSSSTMEELKTTAKQLDKTISLTEFFKGMNAISEYPMTFENDDSTNWERRGTAGNSDVYVCTYLNPNQTRTLTATVVVDKDATLRYEPYNSYDYHGRDGYWYTSYNNYYWNAYNSSNRYCIVDVYVDNKLVRTIDNSSLGRDGWRYFEELTKGKHTIKWVCKNPSESNRQYIDLQYMTVHATPLIEVNLAQAGSLGTEVLYNVDNIDQVRNLKVSGPMNADDFAKIDMMSMLFSLDLSEAQVTEIADNEFNRDTSNGGKKSKLWLHRVVLPKTLKTIGYRSFRYSYVEDIDFTATALEKIGDEAFHGTYLKKVILPETMKSIGTHAFSYNYSLTEASMPNTITTMGTSVFERCYNIKKANFSTSLSTVPDFTFDFCENLEDLTLHNKITSIGKGAFQMTYKYRPTIPTSVKSFGERCFIYSAVDTISFRDSVNIGTAAFKYCKIRNLVIPENATLSNHCFADNKQMVSATLPTTFYAANNDCPILRYNDALKTLTLKSATVVAGDYKDRMLWDCGTAMTIRVPQYLFNSYKQDSYWYNYTLEAFSTADVNTWTICQPLTLFSRDRFEGSPSLVINGNGKLTINGSTAMELNNVQTYKDLSWPWIGTSGMVISNCENVKINGSVSHRAHSYANRWYYICLPFNCKVSDIVTEGGARFAIRYYDGASRAADQTNKGNWKDFPADTTITAGTGFIFQTSKEEYTIFKAVNDADKQNVVSTNEFAKSLQPNYSETSAHKGWNLVGNPYYSYYNIHKLNFTAPITATVDNYYYNSYRWDEYTGTSYKAYSIVDDDYAIKPLEAFFVQCPDEINTLSFPVAGRQLTDEIKSQNAAPLYRAQIEGRQLIDIELSNDELTDQTRVVFNEKASEAYETACDASKFMSENKSMPQLYTMGGDGTQYAINERPAQDGIVRLGLSIPTNSVYTLKVKRNRDAGQIYLKDNQDGNVYDITDLEYTFTAEIGTIENRFELVASDVTGIKNITTQGEAQESDNKVYYDLSGRAIQRSDNGAIPSGIYIIRSNGRSQKVIVK